MLKNANSLPAEMLSSVSSFNFDPKSAHTSSSKIATALGFKSIYPQSQSITNEDSAKIFMYGGLPKDPAGFGYPDYYYVQKDFS
jgi:hypothetical protein